MRVKDWLEDAGVMIGALWPSQMDWAKVVGVIITPPLVYSIILWVMS